MPFKDHEPTELKVDIATLSVASGSSALSRHTSVGSAGLGPWSSVYRTSGGSMIFTIPRNCTVHCISQFHIAIYGSHLNRKFHSVKCQQFWQPVWLLARLVCSKTLSLWFMQGSKHAKLPPWTLSPGVKKAIKSKGKHWLRNEPLKRNITQLLINKEKESCRESYGVLGVGLHQVPHASKASESTTQAYCKKSSECTTSWLVSAGLLPGKVEQIRFSREVLFSLMY